MTTLPERMKFGIFLGPFHRVGENPRWPLTGTWNWSNGLTGWGTTKPGLGNTTAQVGKSSHRLSCSWQWRRTGPVHIKLGSGVISLPYHHPLMVADRMAQLDHMTHGRVLFGVGPGALPGDAYMMGIPHETQRERMDESLGIILRLFTETNRLPTKATGLN